jgi:hypothetical protein
MIRGKVSSENYLKIFENRAKLVYILTQYYDIKIEI